MLSKIEIVKEIGRLILINDFTVYNAKEIMDFAKEKLETNSEWSERLRKNPQLYEEFTKSIFGKNKSKKNN